MTFSTGVLISVISFPVNATGLYDAAHRAFYGHTCPKPVTYRTGHEWYPFGLPKKFSKLQTCSAGNRQRRRKGETSNFTSGADRHVYTGLHANVYFSETDKPHLCLPMLIAPSSVVGPSTNICNGIHILPTEGLLFIFAWENHPVGPRVQIVFIGAEDTAQVCWKQAGSLDTVSNFIMDQPANAPEGSNPHGLEPRHFCLQLNFPGDPKDDSAMVFHGSTGAFGCLAKDHPVQFTPGVNQSALSVLLENQDMETNPAFNVLRQISDESSGSDDDDNNDSNITHVHRNRCKRLGKEPRKTKKQLAKLQEKNESYPFGETGDFNHQTNNRFNDMIRSGTIQTNQTLSKREITRINENTREFPRRNSIPVVKVHKDTYKGCVKLNGITFKEYQSMKVEKHFLLEADQLAHPDFFPNEKMISIPVLSHTQMLPSVSFENMDPAFVNHMFDVRPALPQGPPPTKTSILRVRKKSTNPEVTANHLDHSRKFEVPSHFHTKNASWLRNARTYRHYMDPYGHSRSEEGHYHDECNHLLSAAKVYQRYNEFKNMGFK